MAIISSNLLIDFVIFTTPLNGLFQALVNRNFGPLHISADLAFNFLPLVGFSDFLLRLFTVSWI